MSDDIFLGLIMAVVLGYFVFELIAIMKRAERRKESNVGKRIDELDLKQKVEQTDYVCQLYAFNKGTLAKIAKKDGVTLIYAKPIEAGENSNMVSVREKASEIATLPTTD
jgi:hypothetical protein